MSTPPAGDTPRYGFVLKLRKAYERLFEALRLDDKSRFERLARQLSNPDMNVRFTAAEKPGRLGEKAAPGEAGDARYCRHKAREGEWF